MPVKKTRVISLERKLRKRNENIRAISQAVFSMTEVQIKGQGDLVLCLAELTFSSKP